MKDMKEVRLADLLSIEKGKKIMPAEEPTSIRYIQIEDLRGDANLKWAQEDQDVVACNEKDVLLAWDGANAGEFGYGLKGAVGSTLAKLSPLNGSTHTPYVGHFLKSKTPYLRSKCTGATIPHVNRRVLEDIKIPLPPLPEQRRIAAILDKAQALVANDKRTLAVYDQLAKSLFLEMFGDPVRNERGWEVVKLGQVMRSRTQNGLYIPKERYAHDGVQMVHMSDAFQGIVQPGTLKRVSISDDDRLKYSLEPDDLLVARRSLNYEGSVKPCRIPVSTEPLVYESSLIRLRFNRSMVHPVFVHYYLNNDRARRHHIFKHVTSSTISGINNTGLNAINMYLPPIKLQNRFNMMIERIESDKVSAKTSLHRSEALFGSLLQSAFAGGFCG